MYMEYIPTKKRDVYIRTDITKEKNGYVISVYPILIGDDKEIKFDVYKEKKVIMKGSQAVLDSEKLFLIDLVLEKTGLQIMEG